MRPKDGKFSVEKARAQQQIGVAAMLCVFSPIVLIGLAALSELSVSMFPIREEAAAGIGLCVLLILVAIAVVLFLGCGNRAKEYEYLEKSEDMFDLIIVDLPDPNSESLNKLYSNIFYRMCGNHLKDDGVMVVQSTSPYYATKAQGNPRFLQSR